jgi:hypothetical protein
MTSHPVALLRRIAVVLAVGATACCHGAPSNKAEASPTASSHAPLAYAMHVISFPSGWSLPEFSQLGTRPGYAAMGQNGTVAVILAQWSGTYADPGRCPQRAIRGVPPCKQIQYPAERVLIVRPNGTTTFLYAFAALQAQHLWFGQDRAECVRDVQQCPYFTAVALAGDGTPFVTLNDPIGPGPYSAMRKAAFVWNGSWHVVPKGSAFGPAGDSDTPTNVSIAAAGSALDYAYNGDFENLPSETAVPRGDARDQAAVHFGGQAIQLGVANVTAMRDDYVAGIDWNTGDLEERAVLWRCRQNASGNRSCAARGLGSGIAYGVDSDGEAVGDDDSGLDEEEVFRFYGRPVLWRDGTTQRLSDAPGMADAISQDGSIVGTFDGPLRAFVADARSPLPQATTLDPRVANLGQLHVVAGLGISDDGRILALVQPKESPAPGMHLRLAILVPETR